jgi:hypothetical protein
VITTPIINKELNNLGSNNDIAKLAALIGNNCDVVQIEATLKSLVRSVKYEVTKEIMMELKKKGVID